MTGNAQASEDELQRYHLRSCAKYETLRGIYPNDRRLTGDPCSCGIQALIRTEKLKLLDKFENDCKYNYTTFGNSEKMLQVSGLLKRIEAERSKLEAEL